MQCRCHCRHPETPIIKRHANLRYLVRTESLQLASVFPFPEIFKSSGGTDDVWTSEFSVQHLCYLMCSVLLTDTKKISGIRKIRIDFYIPFWYQTEGGGQSLSVCTSLQTSAIYNLRQG